eukprot:6376342-Pyramimonas_sp.AAC.1
MDCVRVGSFSVRDSIRNRSIPGNLLQVAPHGLAGIARLSSSSKCWQSLARLAGVSTYSHGFAGLGWWPAGLNKA